MEYIVLAGCALDLEQVLVFHSLVQVQQKKIMKKAREIKGEVGIRYSHNLHSKQSSYIYKFLSSSPYTYICYEIIKTKRHVLIAHRLVSNSKRLKILKHINDHKENAT